MSSKARKTVALAGCGIATAAMLAAAGSAKAATLFSTGFETAPTGTQTQGGFTQGAFLTGQGTPVAFTSAVTTGVTSGSGAAVVAGYSTTGFTVAPGSANQQYVQVNDGGGIGTTTAAYYFPNLAPVTPTGILDVVGTVGINSGGTNNAQFGFTAFDGTAAQSAIADVAVNAATGAVTVASIGGARIPTAFTQPVSAVTFESYELQLNYATGTYNVYVAPAGSTTFTNQIATSVPFEVAATTFSTAAIDTFSTATTGTSTGLGLFDNLAITATAVPEPASMSLVLGGLTVLGSRRRRASVAR